MVLAVFFFLFGFQILADTKTPVIKSWKTFQSDVGFEFKYPDCWSVESEDVDYEGPIEGSKMLVLVAGPNCVRSSFSTVSKGITFVGGFGPRKTTKDVEKEIQVRERVSPNKVLRGDYLIFKKNKLGESDAVAWVEAHIEFIRWQEDVFCHDWWISIAGPQIDKTNVDKSLYEKFKKGDLALPEPEKTILESIRCITPKQKGGSNQQEVPKGSWETPR